MRNALISGQYPSAEAASARTVKPSLSPSPTEQRDRRPASDVVAFARKLASGNPSVFFEAKRCGKLAAEDGSAGPADCAEALAGYDALAGLEPEAMIGRRRGAGPPTGHPLDGVLDALGWYGKSFESVDRVHPRLFRMRSGAVIPLEPRFMPVSVALHWPTLARSAPVRAAFAAGSPFLRARHSGARLRAVDFRGKRSAAMIYDRQPIIDHFRRIDDERVLGMMEMPGMARPFFFLLTRNRSSDETRS